MSSPQQPWSPGQPAPTDQPGATGYPAGPGYGPPPGYPAQTPPGHGYPAQGYGAQGYPAQGYGAPQGRPGRPPAYGGGPTGELVINLRKPFGAMGMISPLVTIDGHPAGATWGRNVFQAPVGVRQVDIAQTYLWTYGRASHPVNVDPGRPSEIFYSGPMITFGVGGAIGTEPQRRPGTGLAIGLLAVVVVMLLLVVVLAVAFG